MHVVLDTALARVARPWRAMVACIWLAAQIAACAASRAPATQRMPDAVTVEDAGLALEDAATGAERPASADSRDECFEVDARRDAAPQERGQYCLCEPRDHGPMYWRCYGPDDMVDPELGPVGGVHGAPEARCDNSFTHGDDASCLIEWGPCSDGLLYAVSCIDGVCFCLVDNEPTVELEPDLTCPSGLLELNRDCGWDIKGGTD